MSELQQNGRGTTFYEEMLQDFILTLEKTPETAVCPPPKAPCKEGYYIGWMRLPTASNGGQRLRRWRGMSENQARKLAAMLTARQRADLLKLAQIIQETENKQPINNGQE